MFVGPPVTIETGGSVESMKDISRQTALWIIFAFYAVGWLFIAFLVIWGVLELCGVVPTNGL